MSDLLQVTEGDEVGLLDLLLVMVENLRLLVLGPLVAVMVAMGASFLMQPTYESSFIVAIDRVSSLDKTGFVLTAAAAQTLVHSSEFLDVLRTTADLDLGLKAEVARKALLSRIKLQLGKQDKLLTVVVQGSTPGGAKKLAEVVRDQLFRRAQPAGSHLQRLQARLELERSKLKQGQGLAETLSDKLARGASGATGDADARIYAELIKSNGASFEVIQALESQIEGLGHDDVIQQPTLPEMPAKPNHFFIGLLAWLASGLALLVFVFARSALVGSQADPENAAKWLRIRRALGLPVREA